MGTLVCSEPLGMVFAEVKCRNQVSFGSGVYDKGLGLVRL